MRSTGILPTIVFTTVSVSLLLGCGGVDRDKPMARIEDKIITIGDFLDYFTRASKEEEPENRPTMETVEDVQEFLKIILIKEAMYLEAEKLGYFEDKNFQSQYQLKQNELCQIALYEEVTAPVSVSDDEIKEFYTTSLNEYHVNIIHTNKKSDAEEARLRVFNGEDFLEVLKEMSIDYKEGYKLEPYIIRYALDDIHQQIFKLKKGEISQPILDPKGLSYYVFQVVDITDFEVGEYEEVKGTLYNYILKGKKDEAISDFKRKLLDNSDFHVDEEAIDKIMYGTKEELEKAFEEKLLLSYVGDYQLNFSHIATTDKDLPAPLKAMIEEDPDSVRTMIIDRLKLITCDHLYVEEAYSRGYEKREDIERELHELKEKFAIDKLYSEQFISQLPQPSKEEVIAFYNDNIDKFSDKDNVKAILIRVATEEEAKEVIAEVEKTGDKTSAVKKYSIDEASRDQEMTPGMVKLYRDDPNYPEAASVAFSLETNEHSNPISTPKGYDIIWKVQYNEGYVQDINDESIFNKAFKMIMSNLEGAPETDAKCQAWMEDILNTYDWEMYEDTFNEVLGAAKKLLEGK